MFRITFGLYKKQSQYAVFTERVPGLSVEKLYVCSFYRGDRGSKTPFQTKFNVLMEEGIFIFFKNKPKTNPNQRG